MVRLDAEEVNAEDEEDEDVQLLAGPFGQTQADTTVEDVEDIFARVTLAWRRHNESSAKEIVMKEQRAQARSR